MTNWKKVLEDNRGAIEEKMVELYREWEGNNPDVHEGLAIEPDGTLYTWTYAGNYSEPESVWNGTDFHIATFNAWNGEVDWKAEVEHYREVVSDLLDNIGEKDQEYRCISAEEYYKGVAIGFHLV